MRLKALLLYVLISVLSLNLLSQDLPPKLRHYTSRDGLLSSQVTSISQDKNGFLWASFRNGITRFNGYEFENFTKLINKSSESILYNQVVAHSSGSLLLGTSNNGMIIYDPHNNQSKVFEHQESDETTIGSSQVTKILEDSKGRVWVGTWFGLNLFDPINEEFTRYPFGTKASDDIYNYSAIEDIIEDIKGNIWIATWGGGLHQFLPEQEKFRHYEHFDPSAKKNLWIRAIEPLNDSQLLLGTIGDGLLIFDIPTETFKEINFYPEGKADGFRRIPDLAIVEENELWIGTEEGLIIFDLETKNSHLVSNSGGKDQSILSKYINRLFQDNHGGVWIAAGGLSYYNKSASKFKLFKPGYNYSSKNNETYAFLELSEKEVWVSQNNEIAIWNRNDNSIRFQDYFDGIATFLFKSGKKVFAAIQHNGLQILDLTTMKVSKILIATDPSNGLLISQIQSMEMDADGNLWIGYIEGLTIYRASDGKFLHFQEDQDHPLGLASKAVNNVTIDSNGDIWFLNHRNFMRIKKIDKVLLEKGGPAGIIKDKTLYEFERIGQQDVINRFVAAKDNDLYFCGIQGIYIYDRKSLTQKQILKTEGVTSQSIRSVAVDYQNGAWIGTDNGLGYINLKTNELTTFYEEDGLQSDLFEKNASLKLSDGSVLMGGSQGFNAIQPDKIELNPYAPPIFVTDILIYNQSLTVTQQDSANIALGSIPTSASYLEELVLSHNQNSITFELSSMNFLYPEKNEILVKLDGFDNVWTELKHRRFISYNNLPEGEWLVLNVKSANNNGIWNHTPTTLRIYITPPIYSRAWFRLLVIVFIGMVILALYKLRVRTLKENQKNLELEVQIRTAEIAEQKKEIEETNKSLELQSEHLHTQNQNIELFAEIGRQITSSIKIEDLFNRTFNLISEAIGCEHLAIGKRITEEDKMIYWEMGNDKDAVQQISLSGVQRLSALSIYENKVIRSNDIKNEIHNWLDNPPQYYFDSPYKSVIYIPLNSKTKGTIGIMVAKSIREEAFTDAHLALLENISSYMTIALENAASYEQIREQSDQLKELDRIKTRFYTNISHEFRTPLSLIMGPADEMMKNPTLSYREREYLEIISQNAKRMLKLVTQVLDLSKLEDGVLRLEVNKSDLAKSVISIAESFQFMAQKQNVNLDLEIKDKGLAGYFDEDKIEKILYNLLNNAFKYTDNNGEILVKLERTTLNGRLAASIVIIDTGIGIPESEIGHIFETYYRVENQHTQKQYGAGIGLSLVKKLVELHKGSLKVQSKENEGTMFFVVIPLDKAAYSDTELFENRANKIDSLNFANSDHKVEDHGQVKLQKVGLRSILLVEDNEDLLSFMNNTLQDRFKVLTATNGAEALKLIEKDAPDIIISDVMMPIMNGYKLCETVKKSVEYSHIPFILLTAKNSPESQIEGMNAGADVYLPKPINIDLLRLNIKNLINSTDQVRKKFESKLVTNVESLEVKDENEDFLKKLIDILEKNITNMDVNIDLFANELGMSRTLLYEKTKKATGQSLGIFIKINRLNYAAKLLLENHYNTSELAYEVGFSDPKYFSKCFRKQFGKTPKDYLQSKLSASKR